MNWFEAVSLRTSVVESFSYWTLLGLIVLLTISSSTFSNLFKCFVFNIILKIGPTRGDFPNICEKFARRVFCLKLWNPGVSGAVRSEDTIGRPDDSAHNTNTVFSRIQIVHTIQILCSREYK